MKEFHSFISCDTKQNPLFTLAYRITKSKTLSRPKLFQKQRMVLAFEYSRFVVVLKLALSKNQSYINHAILHMLGSIITDIFDLFFNCVLNSKTYNCFDSASNCLTDRYMFKNIPYASSNQSKINRNSNNLCMAIANHLIEQP